MKKAIKNWFVLTLCTFAAVGFTGCSDDDNNSDNDKPMNSSMITEGYYKGDIYNNETGNLWINFISTNLKWSNEEEDYVGNGDLVCIDFNTELASNPDFATLADGTYTVSEDPDKFTINPMGESYVTKYVGKDFTDYWITGGSVTVSHSGNNIIIKGEFELNYYEPYEFEYVGPVSIINRTLEGQMSNLTSNVNISNFTQGLAMGLGETFTESSDYCIVVLAGKDYDLENNYGNSPSLALGLNITPGSKSIPTGTYTIIDAYDADDYDSFTCLSGVFQPTYGGYFGAWYFSTLEGIEASMQTGTIEVTNNGDSNYTFKFDMKDGYGHSVTGQYSGKINFEDYSEE